MADNTDILYGQVSPHYSSRQLISRTGIEALPAGLLSDAAQIMHLDLFEKLLLEGLYATWSRPEIARRYNWSLSQLNMIEQTLLDKLAEQATLNNWFD